MSEKKHEIWALSLLTVSLLVLFSIVSYSSQDPTIFNPSGHFTANLVGRFGANIAWPLIALLGIGAYGFAITGLWTSWRLLKAPSLEGLWLRLSGIALLILSIMTLGALHWSSIPLLGQSFPTGGKVGSLLAGFLDARLSAVGSHILLSGTLLIALLLATPLRSRSRSGRFQHWQPRHTIGWPRRPGWKTSPDTFRPNRAIPPLNG